MTEQLRRGLIANTPAVELQGELEIDEYKVYTRLPAWGYQHKTICHEHGEYARDA